MILAFTSAQQPDPSVLQLLTEYVSPFLPLVHSLTASHITNINKHSVKGSPAAWGTLYELLQSTHESVRIFAAVTLRGKARTDVPQLTKDECEGLLCDMLQVLPACRLSHNRMLR